MAGVLIKWFHREVLSGLGDETRRVLDELLYPDVARRWRTLDLDVSTVGPRHRLLEGRS